MASATAVMNALMEVSDKFLVQQRKLSSSFSTHKGFCSNVTSKCLCTSGYGGLMCELDINECATNEKICGSYNCINLPGNYKCDCDFFHSGKRCQTSSFIFFSLN